MIFAGTRRRPRADTVVRRYFEAASSDDPKIREAALLPRLPPHKPTAAAPPKIAPRVPGTLDPKAKFSAALPPGELDL